MTELEYVLGRFGEKFASWQGKRILLHGSREYAREILARYDHSLRFLGVMTLDPVGDTFCGKPVYPAEQLASLRPDVLILTERVRHAEAVYQQVAEICLREGIALFDMYGTDLPLAHREIDACRRLSRTGWRRLAEPYDVVAMEAMDTFLYRWPPESPLQPRSELKLLVRWLMNRGTPVFFSLRRSCDEATQLDALWQSGLFTSRADLEERCLRRQGEDLSFRALRERFPDERILYIGTGLVNECLLPRCYDIDTWRLEQEYHILPEEDLRTQTGDEKAQALQERLNAAIEEYDVISFDVFDTLVQRLVLRPEDVFALVEQRASRQGLAVEGFASLRASAQGELPYGTLDEVYDSIADRSQWSSEAVSALKDLELRTEREVLVPRSPVKDLFLRAQAMGKPVVLTSDMYLPAGVLEPLLASLGMAGQENTFVSCDHGCFKQEGLFEEVRARFPGRRIVHIGDHPLRDEAAALTAGLACVRIPSAMELALAAGWEACVSAARSLQERCLAGMSIACCFEDPCVPTAITDMEEAARLSRFAYGAAAPMTAGYLTWLAARLQGSSTPLVLFLARDGYIPNIVWERVRSAFPEMCLPRGMYFYANRRSAFLGCASRHLGLFSFDGDCLCNGLSPEEVLRNYFALDQNAIRLYDKQHAPQEYLTEHLAPIRAQEEETREGYREYCRKHGVCPDAPCAVMDLVSSGSTQTFLEETLGTKLEGFYVGDPSYATREPTCEIHYYLREENPVFLRNFMEYETFMTSPEPSLARMGRDGTPRFAKEVRPEPVLRNIRLVHESMLSYLERFFRLFYAPGTVISPGLAEELYAADGLHQVTVNAFDDFGLRTHRD